MLRVVIGINGLMIAYFGNRAPKTVAPSSHARQVTRVSGWSSVLSGLVYAGLWALTHSGGDSSWVRRGGGGADRNVRLLLLAAAGGRAQQYGDTA